MKYFDVDWRDLLAALSVWGVLPVSARRAVLKVKPSAGAPAGELGGELAGLVAVGIVTPSPTGKRVTLSGKFRGAHLVLRAMDRQRIWDVPTEGSLVDYVQEHFTPEEVRTLLRQPYVGHDYGLRRALADRVSSEAWVQEFLAADTPAQAVRWERQRLAAGESPWFGEKEVFRATQELVKELLARPGPVPLREAAALFSGAGSGVAAVALHAAIRYLLLFAGMRDEDLEPVVGPWPEAAARLREGTPAPPGAVEPGEAFDAAWLMEDMTTVLVAASAEPLRLRGNDLAIFARTRQEIEARLVSLPGWVEEAVGASPEVRVESAAALLRGLGLAHDAGKAGEDLRLEPTRKGAQWLARPGRERLKTLLDPVLKSKEQSPPSWYEAPAFGFFPMRASSWMYGTRLDLRAEVTRLYLSLPEGFVPLEAFLKYARRVDNPFLGPGAKPGSGSYWGGRTPLRNEWERVWGEILAGFLAGRLAPLGGARLGRTPRGELCFALTGVGRYLLGAAGEFEYGEEAQAQVVVQPDFEIVFLAPAPQVEAQVARFAERVGKGPGVMFRLTRASVLGAAEAGTTERQIVETLRSASTRDLPANVVRQVHDWLAGVRRVRMRPAVLVECPDAETAARVQAAAGKQLRRVTDTLLELAVTTRGERSAVLKKLRAAGVFVE